MPVRLRGNGPLVISPTLSPAKTSPVPVVTSREVGTATKVGIVGLGHSATNELPLLPAIGLNQFIDSVALRADDEPVHTSRLVAEATVLREVKRWGEAFEVLGRKETAEQCFAMLAPGGTATIVGMIPFGQKIELHGFDFLREKRIQGSSMGSNRFRIDMPRYIDFYMRGLLKLDEMITRTGKLEDVNDAFRAMKAGEVARTVLTFD